MSDDIKSWENGTLGGEIKKIIDDNFNLLDERTKNLNKNMEVYTKDFSISNWASGSIFIPYAIYNKYNPCVELYIKNGNSYLVVYSGYVLRDDGIEIQSDIAYEGRVVIR